MPKVEKSGTYRNAKGHALRLVEGAVISAEVAASYALDGETQPVPGGEEIRDGVVDDGDGGERSVKSAIVEQRDAEPVAAIPDGAHKEIKLGGAPENRMEPPPAENRRGKKQAHNAATDVELGEDESGD